VPNFAAHVPLNRLTLAGGEEAAGEAEEEGRGRGEAGRARRRPEDPADGNVQGRHRQVFKV
jgi:hypothetical protein